MVEHNPMYFKRFRDIDEDYICTDKHIHSNWTDGQASISEITREAKIIGLRQIAITDHIRADSIYFDKYCQEIERVSEQTDLKLLIGFEAKVKNSEGDIDVLDEVLEKAQIRIASVHRFPVGPNFYRAEEFEKKACQEFELRLSLAVLEKRKCNVLGHAGGMSLVAHKEFPLDYFEQIIRKCQQSNIAFELNGLYHLSVLDSLKLLLSKYNPFVSLGSDAHRVEDIGSLTGMLKLKINYE